MRYILLLMVGVLFFVSFAEAQQITVLDKETNRPMPYVNLCFESLQTHQKQYTVTNPDGKAHNLCHDSCVLAVSFIGYHTLMDTLSAGEEKIFYMEPHVFNLDQVVVTASRSRKSLKEVPVITQVITSREISNRGITNVKDVLEQDIPGIELQRGGFGTDIKMQGLEAKNILVLVDGERLAGETGYNVDYSRLNTADIERIEVVKGASSALYGSQAMGGVINIITKKSVKKWELNVGGYWAQRNEKNFPALSHDDDQYTYKKHLDKQNMNFNLSAGFNLKKVSGRTDFIIKSFDAYKLYDKEPVTKKFINIDTVIVDNLNPFPTGINGYSDYQISQKLDFPVNDKLEIALKGSYYNHDDYDFVPDKVHQKFIDYTYGGKVSYTPHDRFHVTGSFNYDNYKKYDFFEKLDDKALNYRNIFIDPKITAYGKAGKRQEVTGGVEIFSESLFSDKLFTDTAGTKSNVTYIAFLQDDINATEHLNFIAGGRLDYHSVYGAHFSPKISGMYKFQHFTFRLNYAKGFRSPSLKELYIDWQVAWFTIKGDENLKPETNNYLSGSLEYVNGFIDISATGYYNKLKNKIDGIWENGQTVYQYVNVSEAQLSGLDILAKINILNSIVVSGGYSYLHDKRPQGELVSSASPHTGNVKINYHFEKKNYRLNANLSATIIGAKDFIMSDYITYHGEYVEGFYPVHFDAYSIWRLAVSQHFYGGINLTLGVDNLFNYTAKVVSFNTSTSPGRRFFINLNISLDNLIHQKSIQ